ncbi:MAG: TetR/AcrR family transcriptional regulator [Alphaproteobacteria bacterium]|nr:TetR/AcrR family transcriptional regulator [Alphaproteobacteria bacterium]MCB9791564.1 TetR/AcrR family transcriptional regulator [Alphaproteobacteria bacterium]
MAHDPEQTRARILDAALSLFAEQGFHGTSVPEIARRADVGAGSIYRHFESKEGLVNALYVQLKEGFYGTVAQVEAEKRDTRAQFRAMFTALMGWALSNPQGVVFLELHHHGDYIDPAVRARYAGRRHPLDTLAERGVAEGLLKPLPLPAIQAAVQGVYMGWLRAAMLGEVVLDEAGMAAAEACAWDAVRI